MDRNVRRRARAAALLAAAVSAAPIGALAACSPDESAFQTKAEQVVADEIRQQLDLESEVDCEAPSSVDVGTTFTCTARAADGTRYDFVAEITGDDTVTVTLQP